MTNNLNRLAVEKAIRDLETIESELISTEPEWLQINMPRAYLASILQELEKDYNCQSKIMIDHYAKEAIESLSEAYEIFFRCNDSKKIGTLLLIVYETFSVDLS